MRQWRMHTAAALLGLLLWGLAGSCWAAAGGHHAEFNLTDEIFRWINFIILAVVLYIIVAKILPRVLAERRQKIEQAIAEAQASRVEAQQLLQDNQRKTAHLQEELAQLQ